MSKDYYKILGVTKTATEEDIKKAYRKLAHQYHPDKPSGNESKFKEVNEAYQILSNREKRAQYDRFGTVFEGGQPGGGFGGFGFGGAAPGGFGVDFNFDGSEFENLGDIFDAFFEGLGVKNKRRTYEHGADIEIVQEITLEEAYKGVKKHISYKTMVRCDQCSGLGHSPEAGFDQCQVCNGRGEIKENRNTFFGNFSRVAVCTKCHGAGQIPKKICGTCSGNGRNQGTRDVTIDIRPGTADGQIIKFTKQGETGERGAENGDLYVRIKIKPHSIFARRGDDLFIKKEVKLTDILLEKAIPIPTISGNEVKVKIPNGFDVRENLVIPGEGITKHANLHVILEVKTPKKISSKAKKLLEDLEKEL